MSDRDDIAAWLRLLETPGIGRVTARRLLAAFGSPQAVLAAPAGARQRVVGSPTPDLLNAPSENVDALIASTLAWLDARSAEARAIVTLDDPRYPALLLNTADPPLLLYARGRLDLLQTDAVAIVGSRNPTPQGADNARAFALHLGRAGLTVVSGLALGIDAAAHEGALAGGAGTIAVVGTGLDQAYPRRNRDLMQRIAAEGLLLSEFALGTEPLAPNFPVRNRIIAGLGRGTLVVEAAVQSGSLITARLAAEAGREVFAIPGSIHSPQARGCHALIKQGAKLVEQADDILDELRPGTPRAAAAVEAPRDPRSDDADDAVLEALGFDPTTLDALSARTGRSAADLSVRLLAHELEGRVVRLPGQLFQRVERG